MNEPCILFHIDVTAAAETSIVSCIYFQARQTHLSSGNYYADSLLCTRGLYMAVIFTVDMITDNEIGSSCFDYVEC